MSQQDSPEIIDFNSANLVYFLLKWRKTLLIVAIGAVLLSAIFTGPTFIAALYRSTVTMYPVASNSVSKSMLSVTGGDKENILGFGEAEQAEQMLQILHSNKLREKVIETFDLMNHYQVRKDSKYKKTELYRKFKSNIRFKRTEYMAVEVQVLDEDARIASDIANFIAEEYDVIKNDMQRERAAEAFKIIQAEYDGLRDEIQEIEDSLTVLRSKGLHDYESQAEVINQQLAIAISSGNKQAMNALQVKLDVMAQYGSAYIALSDRLEYEIEQLSLVKAKYKEARVDATQSIPQKFVVDYAFPAEKKYYPVRWIIVLITTLSSLFFSIIIIILIEQALKKKQMRIS